MPDGGAYGQEHPRLPHLPWQVSHPDTGAAAQHAEHGMYCPSSIDTTTNTNFGPDPHTNTCRDLDRSLHGVHAASRQPVSR